MDYKDLEDGLESISRAFPAPDYAISVLHGKMKAEDKEKSMQYFVKGITNIMVATTVIEVGIDHSEATIMVIENAERFGLTQLHQLRGRVGRSSLKSFCYLVQRKQTVNSEKRLSIMEQTNDGFLISILEI